MIPPRRACKDDRRLQESDYTLEDAIITRNGAFGLAIKGANGSKVDGQTTNFI